MNSAGCSVFVYRKPAAALQLLPGIATSSGGAVQRRHVLVLATQDR